MTELDALTPDDCWRFLAKRVVGRIGFDLGHGPRIYPVNYRVDGRTVILRTAGESEVARFVDLFAAGSLVAFENSFACGGPAAAAGDCPDSKRPTGSASYGSQASSDSSPTRVLPS